MNCFRYKIEHDFGFAPNPFHGTLSLATCKGDIRKNKNLQLGDWIVGLGSKSMGNLHLSSTYKCNFLGADNKQ